MWTDAADDHLEKGKLFRQKTEEPRGNITKQIEKAAKRTATAQSRALAEQIRAGQSLVAKARDRETERGGPTRLLAQLAGRWGPII